MTKPTVFITGATSGIGLATAKLFAQNQYPLVINGRRKDRLEDLQKELSPLASVELAPFDVADKKQMEGWVQSNSHLLSHVGILVNNAGLALGSDAVHSAQTSDWDQMIDTNIKGLLYMTRQFLPAFLKNKNGHIVNLGSVAGRWVYPGGAVYCATKYAVRAISEGIRLDVQGSGIRVTNIEPGMVETEFSEIRFRGNEKAKAVYKGLTPLSAEDIAETIFWSVSRPAHVNIQEIVIYPTAQASVRDVHRV